MISVTDEIILNTLSQYFWPFCRIGSFLMVVPIFGSQLIPHKVRLFLALALTALIAPNLKLIPLIPIFSINGFFFIISECLTGVVLAFWVHLLFQIGAAAGQFIALQNGMGFSMLIDPMNGTSTTVISQIFLVLSNLVFFLLNGHLVLIKTLADSFIQLPFNRSFFSPDVYLSFANSINWVFEAGLLIALPAVIALLVVNVAMGVISKVTPQFNVFSVGFPFTMIFGLIVLWVCLTLYVPIFERSMQDVFSRINHILSN